MHEFSLDSHLSVFHVVPKFFLGDLLGVVFPKVVSICFESLISTFTKAHMVSTTTETFDILKCKFKHTILSISLYIKCETFVTIQNLILIASSALLYMHGMLYEKDAYTCK